MRRTLAPVLAVAASAAASRDGVVLRGARAGLTAVEVWLWVLAFMLPLLCVAFLVGLARWWLFIAHSRGGSPRGSAATPGLRSSGGARGGVRRPVAGGRLLGRGRGGTGRTRPAGRPSSRARRPSGASPRSRRRPADRGDRPRRALGRRSRLHRDARRAYALMTLENHRLSAQAAALLREVASRARACRPPPTTNGGGSSATCTTARSSGSSPSRIKLGARRRAGRRRRPRAPP